MTGLVALRLDRKRIPLDQRPTFTIAANALADAVHAEASRFGEEVVILSTCERFEIYFTSASVAVNALVRGSPLTADACTERDEAAVRHLFRVASGLDSRIPGEPHVVGQVRDALEVAQRRGTAHRGMVDLFRRALECGRRVRARIPFAAGAAGYPTRVIDRLRTELGTLAGRHVLIVGTGVLAADVARSLRDEGVDRLTIAGRHEMRVAEFAQRFDARPLILAALHDEPLRFDAVVTAASTSQPIIGAAMLRTCRCDLLVDLGASPNVDPAVRSLRGVRVFGIDDLGGATVRASTLARAGDAVERELTLYRSQRRRSPDARALFPAAS